MKKQLLNAAKLLTFFKGRKDKEAESDMSMSGYPMNKIGNFRMRCNICSRAFRANSRFLRFCRTCRTEEELFRFAEWLPSHA